MLEVHTYVTTQCCTLLENRISHNTVTPQCIPNNIILISKVAARDQSAQINTNKIYSISRSKFIINPVILGGLLC